MTLLIKNLPTGSIIWNEYDVIGIVGIQLDHCFDDCECKPSVGTNPHDFDIIVTDNIKDKLTEYHTDDE